MTPHAFPPNIAKSRTTPSPPESLLHILMVQLVWVTNVTIVTGKKIKEKQTKTLTLRTKTRPRKWRATQKDM